MGAGSRAVRTQMWGLGDLTRSRDPHACFYCATQVPRGGGKRRLPRAGNCQIRPPDMVTQEEDARPIPYLPLGELIATSEMQMKDNFP